MNPNLDLQEEEMAVVEERTVCVVEGLAEGVVGMKNLKVYQLLYRREEWRPLRQRLPGMQPPALLVT